MVLYRILGIKYNSPTVNSLISRKDFFVFCNNLKEYFSYELEEYKDHQFNYPAGILKSISNLPDVCVYFSHENSFKEAKEKWDRRKTKVNYDNIFVMYDTHMYCEEMDCYEFENFKYKNKVIFIYDKYKKLVKNNFLFNFYNKEKYNPNIFFNQSHNFLFNFFNIEEFDYITWLNTGKIKKNPLFKYKDNTNQ